MTRLAKILAVLTLPFVLFLLPGLAGAHPAIDFIKTEWDLQPTDNNVQYGFDDNFPIGGGIRDRVHDGTNHWGPVDKRLGSTIHQDATRA